LRSIANHAIVSGDKLRLHRSLPPNRTNHHRWRVVKNFIDSDFIKVKFLFQPSEVRKAELQRTYDRLIDRAKDRVYMQGIHDNHHILPKSLGGSNAKSNIAILTYREHFLAHWLLSRLTTGQDRISMLYAINRMTSRGKNNKNRIVSGWQYDLAMKAKSEATRIRMKGTTFLADYSRSDIGRAGHRERGKLNTHLCEYSRSPKGRAAVGKRMKGNTYRSEYLATEKGRNDPRMLNNKNAAKLTIPKAVEIFTTVGSKSALSKIFEVSSTTISRIKNKCCWKDIHPIPGWDYENKCWESN